MTQCNIHSAKVNPAPVLAARTIARGADSDLGAL